MSTERRHFTRVAFAVPAQLVTAGGQFAVKVHDLSFKGALVSLVKPVPLTMGTPCQLHVMLDQGHDRITMDATVAHLEGDSIGLLCRSIDLDSMTHLRRLIELQLADPALLDRELKALLAR
jgi:hypothetical protein